MGQNLWLAAGPTSSNETRREIAVDFDSRIRLIDELIYRYLERTKLDETQVVKPVDVMPYLVAHEVYAKDHREGLPLRKDLRRLDELDQLHRIRTLGVERKAKNRYWSFKRP
jgi:hypothetical protein